MFYREWILILMNVVVSSIILPVFSSCGFTLICEKDENRLVAENVLNLIIRHLQEYCQILLQPSEVHYFVSKFYMYCMSQVAFSRHSDVGEWVKLYAEKTSQGKMTISECLEQLYCNNRTSMNTYLVVVTRYHLPKSWK